jgi:lysyl endopeptidase
MNLRPWILLLLSSPFAVAAPPGSEFDLPVIDADAVLTLPRIDTAKALGEDAAASKHRPGPVRYALGHAVDAIRIDGAKSRGGEWSSLPDGRLLWRLQVHAPEAVSLDLGFSEFRLPHGAELWVTNPMTKERQGPFTDADNPVAKEFWTPILRGDTALLELTVPAGKREFLRLQLDTVHHGYKDLMGAVSAPKSGSCNVDVVCPEGDAWRDEIRSVAVVAYNNSGTREGNGCSGQFVNTTAPSAGPVFLSANHCEIEGPSARVYFNFQNSTCRTPGSVASGQNGDGPLNVSLFGATTLALTDPNGGVVSSDFALYRFTNPAPGAANLYLSGWDRRDLAPGAVTGIHHPQGDEKRISFENNPLAVTAYDGAPGSGTTHLRVLDWDLGTTEQGSSGSGIWTNAGHVVGVLSGGVAACGNDEPDWYGRLAHAWEGLGSPDRRLKDWLDNGGTGAQTLDGKNACNFTLTLASHAFGTAPSAGAAVQFTATATGQSGAVTYAWDLDGDGITDRTGSANQVSATYPRSLSTQVRVSAVDAAGCTGAAGNALDVVAATLDATAGTPQQVCGDNDGAIEPGERWSIPVTLRNNGGATLPAGARALFVPGTLSTPALATADINGNGFGPRDDARTVDPIALGGGGLKLYGQTYAQAFMSTNGYIGFSPAETGADWSNACNGGVDNGATAPQLRPLHDDLKVSENTGAGLRYAYYASCPRAPESAPAAQGCHVFQWSRVQWVNSNAVNEVEGDASFQAIVYQPSGQIVYQYLAALPNAGNAATIGVIGAGGADPLDAACNAANAAPTGRAICLFDPGAGPGGGFPAGSFGPNTYGYRGFTSAQGSCAYTPIDLAAVTAVTSARLETPSLSVTSLGSGQQTTLQVPIAVPPATACGAALKIDYIGTAAPDSFSLAPETVLQSTVGGGGACQVSNACPAQVPSIGVRPGIYSNPSRGGNGLTHFVYGTVYGSAWYTALSDRTPTWYLLAGSYADNLATAPITRVRNAGAPGGLTPVTDVVGTAWAAQIDADHLLYAYRFDDGPSGMELMNATPLPFASPNRTQIWRNTGESGWGLAIESLVTGGSNVLDFIGAYVYDSSGVAPWVTGSSNNDTGGPVTLSAYRVHCPACPWLPDWNSSPLPAGTLNRTYTGPTSATLDTAITLPAPFTGNWNRSGAPLQPFAPPSPAQQQ